MSLENQHASLKELYFFYRLIGVHTSFSVTGRLPKTHMFVIYQSSRFVNFIRFHGLIAHDSNYGNLPV